MAWRALAHSSAGLADATLLTPGIYFASPKPVMFSLEIRKVVLPFDFCILPLLTKRRDNEVKLKALGIQPNLTLTNLTLFILIIPNLTLLILIIRNLTTYLNLT